MESITVWVYKGARRAETYLYVSAKNDFERVPKDLLDAMGAWVDTVAFILPTAART